jgi:hypothetical protein
MPDINNLRKERFILVHGFREFSPWLLDPMCLGRTSWWWNHVAENLLQQVVDWAHPK